MVLTELYEPENLNLNYKELLQKATEVTLTVSSEELNVAEEKTRGQARSRLWFRMRAG